MGLSRAARPAAGVGLGRQRAPARRRARALRAVARGAVRVRGPGAPDRRPGPGHPRAGRCHPGLAVRPDGHRDLPGHREGQRVVRRCREALRRRGAAVSAAAREPQRRRRESQSCCGATVLAHPARRRVRRGGPGPPGPLVRHPRGHPSAAHRRRAVLGRHDRRRGAAADGARAVPRPVVGDSCGVRAGVGLLPREPVLRSRRSCMGPRSPSPSASAPITSTSPPPRAAAHRTCCRR